jgi:SAM-dependent methyltransferase
LIALRTVRSRSIVRTPELPPLACPECLGDLRFDDDQVICMNCDFTSLTASEIPDLRTRSDRFMSLAEDRLKADRLAAIAERTDLAHWVAAYYEMTPDVDARQAARFQSHVERAELRGQALYDQLPRRGTILEIGCGAGGLITAAARSGRTVVGVDIAIRWLIGARRRLRDASITAPLVAACAEALPWSDGSFDVVAADSLLEHLDEPAAALGEFWRVLRPGGTMLLWSPNRYSIAADPHVGLWGIGFLPRRWSRWYVRWRRALEYGVRPMSVRECSSLLDPERWDDVTADSAPMTPTMGRTRGERVALCVHRRLRALPLFRSLVRELGPVWQVRAIKKETA